MTKLELKKSLLSCPGDTIQEHLDEIMMSQAELAERLGRSIPKLNELIKGKAPLTKDTATKLEYVLDIPAEFWLNLERRYQDELLKIERMENLARFIEWLKPFTALSGGSKTIQLRLLKLTDRQKDYHAFWFTFYHELGHILYHGKKDIFMEGIDGIQPDQAKEAEADAFAARMLLSEKERNELFQYPEFYKELILELSEQFKKHPAILVGQVQRVYHRYYKDRELNGLKVRVAF